MSYFSSIALGLGLLPDVKKPKLMRGTLIMKDNVSEKVLNICIASSEWVFIIHKWGLGKQGTKVPVSRPSFLERVQLHHTWKDESVRQTTQLVSCLDW